MMRLLVVVLLGGCTVGAGSAYVGQWRQHHERVLEACLEDETGACVEHKVVDVDVPARKFWGATLEWSMGVAADDGAAFRVEYATSFIRGRGRFAWAMRGGVILDVERSVSTNAMAFGYYSLLPRLALRAGLGYVPWAMTTGPLHPSETHETTHLGGRALVGAQYVVKRSRGENFLVLSLDVDRMYLGFERAREATGVTSSIGLFF
ncbi:MAG TPA: hypothetical protein VGM90_13980 [Kofleriaceae bacterium]|jgi:hypothetical protein